MPKKPSILVGLELDPSGITAAAVSTAGGLEIRHAVTTTLDPGIVRDGEVSDVDALAEALRDMWRDEKGLDRRVRIGIANQKIVVRVIELPPIADAKELAQAVRFQAQDQIPMPLDAAVLDHQVLETVDTPQGPRQRILLVAARRDMVERVLSAARAAGLRPEGIDLSAFAMVRALAPSSAATASDGAVLYVSVGGLTNIAVATGLRCTFTRVVGAGLEQLAIELGERRQLTLEHARGWLTHVGLERPVDAIDGDAEVATEARSVLQEGVRRIAADVRNSVDFHRAQGADQPVARCVLAGPAAGVPGFADAFGVELGLPVDVGDVPGGPDGMGAHLAIAAGLSIPESLAA